MIVTPGKRTKRSYTIDGRRYTIFIRYNLNGTIKTNIYISRPAGSRAGGGR